MQQTAVHNGSGAAALGAQGAAALGAQGAQAARGNARAAAGSHAAAGPMAGFAALLASLGQDEEGAGLLPGGALGAGADESSARSFAGNGLPGQGLGQGRDQVAAETGEPDDPAPCTPQDLAMLLAGLGQPAPAVLAGEQEQSQPMSMPMSDGASGPWQQLEQPASDAVPVALAGGQALPSPDGMPGLGGGAAVQQLPLGQSTGGHWTSTSLVAETGRLDGSRQSLAPEQAGTDTPRPGPARGGRAHLPAGRAQPGMADTVARLTGRGVPAGAVAAFSAVQGSVTPQAPAGDPAAAGARSGMGVDRDPQLPVRQDSIGTLAATALTGASLQPAAAGGQRPGRGDAGQPDGQTLYGNAPAVGAAEPDAASPGIGSDAAWQADLDAAQAELAENITYWVHQQTQNAALTLEGDGQAVQVQVALTGDQAHITFRSDEEQARQLLDAGTQELRELLDAQGLQLAGVTIGMASSDGPGAGGNRQPGQPSGQGARQGVVRAQGSEGDGLPAPGRRTAGVTESSVDIFV